MARLRGLCQKEFYVCFFGREKRKHAYDYITDKEYRHILLMSPINDKQVLIIDPILNTIGHNIENRSIEAMLKHVKSIAGSRIIKYNRPYSSGKRWRFRGIYNCVTLTKAVLNIWGWSITPKQLFHYIIAQGGTIIKG